MDSYTKGKHLALRFLGARMYTTREIYDRLRRKGYDDELAEKIVSDLIEEGALNDKFYAECYITDSVNLGAKGEYRIRQELLRKGVAASLIDRAFNEADVDFDASLREYIKERLRVTEISDYKDLMRFKASLARRGYSPGDIRRALQDFEFDFSGAAWENN